MNFTYFCGGSPFMDIDLLWNNFYPQFTRCFNDTVLTATPSVWLWVTSPLLFVLVYKWDTMKSLVPVGKLNLAKCIITSLLIGLSLSQIIAAGITHSRRGESVFRADVVFESFRAFSLLYSIILLQVVRRAGAVTSGFTFTFWVLELLTKVVLFYEHTLHAQHESWFDICVFYAQFSMVVAMVILNGFAEPRVQCPLSERAPCPEMSASFLSRITFSYCFSLLRLGVRKTIVEDDIWDLRPDMKCSVITARIRYHWLKLYASFRESKTALRECQQPSLSIIESINGITQVSPDEETPLLSKPHVKVIQPRKGSNRRVSLTKVLAKAFFWDIIGTQLLVVVHITFVFIQPLVLRQLINFSDKSVPWYSQQWKGYLLAVALFLCGFFMCLALQNVFVHGRFGLRIKSALITLIYKKALTITTLARKDITIGEIVNLMSVDTVRVYYLLFYLWNLWSGPVEIIIAVVLLYSTIGPSVFAGLGVIVLLIPLNVLIMMKIWSYQTRQMEYKDERLKVMSEILGGMKVLKLYAWEGAFEEKVRGIRQRELALMRKFNYMNALSQLSWTMTPYLVSLASFATYIYVSPDHYLSPDKAFVAIALFNILRYSINLFPMVITDAIRAKVSLDRISNYLSQDDIDLNNVSHDQSEDSAIVIEHGHFQWDPALGVCLSGIDLRVKEGELLAVVGQVGCGKSSLISAVLGDMVKLSGRVNVKGRVAFVPQEAWIQNASLRDNVLFGRSYDEERYQNVLDACALTTDLEVLPGGDLTEIGEKGINLSGGQKQRVSLARAVYNNADIYLLDDPLSAVDAHVGKHIFERVLSKTGLLSKKTCILVTHGIHWLPHVDEIVVLVDGSVSECGSYNSLVRNNGSFAQFLRSYQNDETRKAHPINTPDNVSVTSRESNRDRRISYTSELDLDIPHIPRVKLSSSPSAKYVNVDEPALLDLDKPSQIVRATSVEHLATRSGNSTNTVGEATLIEEERNEEGGVRLSVYGAYFRAMGLVSVSVFLVIYAGYMAMMSAGNVWLSAWTDDPLLANASATNSSAERLQKNNYYLGIYGAFGCCQSLLVLISAFGMANCYMVASQRLHDDMLNTVMRCAMSFFDTTPIGRILNRFSKDMDAVDEDIPTVFGMFVDSSLAVVGILAVISYSTPMFLTVILPLILLFYFIQRMYLKSSRQLKRLESRTRSPIFSHFSETVNGAAVIRAYDEQSRFIRACEDKTDLNQMCFYYSFISNRWLGFYLDTLGNLALLAATIFVVSEKNHISKGIVGLSISYAMELTGSLTWMIRMASDLETNVVSVERIVEYTHVQTEAQWHGPLRPPPNWPGAGEVVFDRYSTRYRPTLDLVLKGLSFRIHPGQKVGIVGRTGAGKSSVTLSLFRIIEPASGAIYVDGWDITDMGLHDVRANFTILPQDPVLFSGSLRMNLDPFDKSTDVEIWCALEHAHMKSFVAALPQGLEHECGEGGANLSVGQKQLICLARSLLRKTKLLILDEATAAVDMETDELIQDTIRVEFADCTILTIAHRLNTIMDYDKILVLDNGCVVEFDSPDVLLRDKKGIFHSMAVNAGIISERVDAE